MSYLASNSNSHFFFEGQKQKQKIKFDEAMKLRNKKSNLKKI